MAQTLIGSGASYTSTRPQFPLGTQETMSNQSYIYAKAASTLSASSVITLDGSFNSAAGTGYTSPAVSVTSGDYFWARKTTSPF
jgi:hypothetical protein